MNNLPTVPAQPPRVRLVIDVRGDDGSSWTVRPSVDSRSLPAFKLQVGLGGGLVELREFARALVLEARS